MWVPLLWWLLEGDLRVRHCYPQRLYWWKNWLRHDWSWSILLTAGRLTGRRT